MEYMPEKRVYILLHDDLSTVNSATANATIQACWEKPGTPSESTFSVWLQVSSLQ